MTYMHYVPSTGRTGQRRPFGHPIGGEPSTPVDEGARNHRAMLTVIAQYRARAGKGAEIARVLARHSTETRAEPGCVTFVAYRDPDDPDHFVLYEQYLDEAAFDAHRRSPHFAANVQRDIVPLLEHRMWHRYEEIRATDS
jgi:quinol monooxygenase YgiN